MKLLKKIMVILCLLVIFLVNNVRAEEIIIPNDAIRIRVIANSNSVEDQYIKSQVRDDLQLHLQELLVDAKSIDEVRKTLNDNLKDFDFTVERVLEKHNVNMAFDINYGLNFFPEKEFKGVVYEEGYYESIVVTLGKGNGDNWWCVLFPPLCLMEAEEQNIDNVEYRSFIKETLDKFFEN